MLGALPLENECADLFRQIGFTASTTARTNDGNIDIALEKDGRRGAAQCKAWRKPCGVRIVREFLGTLCANNFDFGYLIARSGFTPRATELLQRLPMIEAWDVRKLVTVGRETESFA
jgi:HJR/Mrr/RecB family endonuclease